MKELTAQWLVCYVVVDPRGPWVCYGQVRSFGEINEGRRLCSSVRGRGQLVMQDSDGQDLVDGGDFGGLEMGLIAIGGWMLLKRENGIGLSRDGHGHGENVDGHCSIKGPMDANTTTSTDAGEIEDGNERDRRLF